MPRICTAATAAAVVLFPCIAQAQGTALAARIGTLGPSVGVVHAISSNRLNVRLDMPYLSYTRNDITPIDEVYIDYRAKLNLFGLAANADWHPFRSGLRVSGGVLYNSRSFEFTGHSSGPYTLGQVTFSEADIGTLSGEVKLGGKFAQYIGVGFGNAVAAHNKLGFLFDLGVLHQGKPEVSMSGTGMIAPTAEEASKIEANLEWFEWYPNLSIGLSYKVR